MQDPTAPEASETTSVPDYATALNEAATDAAKAHADTAGEAADNWHAVGGSQTSELLGSDAAASTVEQPPPSSDTPEAPAS